MKLWDVTKNDSSQYLEFVNQSEYSSISSISWNKNDRLLCWVTSLGEMYLMDPESKEILCMDKTPSSSGLSAVTFSRPYENIFFVGHNSGEVSLNIFDSSLNLKKKKYELHSNKVSALVSSRLNENLLISLSLDQTVSLFDLNEGKSIQALDVGYPLLSGDLNEADYTLVVGGVGGAMEKFDLRKLDKPIISFTGHGSKDVRGVSFNRRYIKKKMTKFMPKSEKNVKPERFSSILKVNQLSDKMQKFEDEIKQTKPKVRETESKKKKSENTAKRKSVLEVDAKNQSDSKSKKPKKSGVKSKKKDQHGQSKSRPPKTKSAILDMDKKVAQIEGRLPGRLAKEDMDELKMFIRSEVGLIRSTTCAWPW